MKTSQHRTIPRAPHRRQPLSSLDTTPFPRESDLRSYCAAERVELQVESLTTLAARATLTMWYAVILSAFIVQLLPQAQWRLSNICGAKYTTNMRHAERWQSPCIYIQPSGDSSGYYDVEWRGSNVPEMTGTLKRFHRIAFSLPPPSSQVQRVQKYVLDVRSVLSLRSGRILNVTLPVEVRCELGQLRCTLFRVPLDVDSGAAVSLNVTLKNVETLWADAIAVQGAAVGVAFQRHSYTLGVAIWRYAAMLLSLLHTMRFIARCKYTSSIYEQHWIFFLQLALIWYLDPLYAVSLLSDSLPSVLAFIEFRVPTLFLTVMIGAMFSLIVASVTWPVLPSSQSKRQEIVCYRVRPCDPPLWARLVSAVYVAALCLLNIVDSIVSNQAWLSSSGDSVFTTSYWVLHALLLAGAVACLALLLYLRNNLGRRPYLSRRPQQLACRMLLLVFTMFALYSLVHSIIFFVYYNRQRPAISSLQPYAQLTMLMVCTFQTNILTLIYTNRSRYGGVPVDARDMRWKCMVWPDAWYSWLARHGGSGYIFTTEEEEMKFYNIQYQFRRRQLLSRVKQSSKVKSAVAFCSRKPAVVHNSVVSTTILRFDHYNLHPIAVAATPKMFSSFVYSASREQAYHSFHAASLNEAARGSTLASFLDAGGSNTISCALLPPRNGALDCSLNRHKLASSMRDQCVNVEALRNGSREVSCNDSALAYAQQTSPSPVSRCTGASCGLSGVQNVGHSFQTSSALNGSPAHVQGALNMDRFSSCYLNEALAAKGSDFVQAHSSPLLKQSTSFAAQAGETQMRPGNSALFGRDAVNRLRSLGLGLEPHQRCANENNVQHDTLQGVLAPEPISEPKAGMSSKVDATIVSNASQHSAYLTATGAAASVRNAIPTPTPHSVPHLRVDYGDRGAPEGQYLASIMAPRRGNSSFVSGDGETLSRQPSVARAFLRASRRLGALMEAAERNLIERPAHTLDRWETHLFEALYRPFQSISYLPFFNLETAIDCLNMSNEAYFVAAPTSGEDEHELHIRTPSEAYRSLAADNNRHDNAVAMHDAGCGTVRTIADASSAPPRHDIDATRAPGSVSAGTDRDAYRLLPVAQSASCIDVDVTREAGRRGRQEALTLTSVEIAALQSSLEPNPSSNGSGRADSGGGGTAHDSNAPWSNATGPRGETYMNVAQYGYTTIFTTTVKNVQAIVVKLDTTATQHKDKAARLIIAFRGTVNLSNMRHNLNLRRIIWDEMQQAVLEDAEAQRQRGQDGGLLGKHVKHFSSCTARCGRASHLRRPPTVHSGYLALWNALREAVLDKVESVLRSDPNHIYRVFVTGHSMGGALGCLCAYSLTRRLRLMDYPIPDVTVYTFGQPCFSNRTFRRVYDKTVPRTFRVMNEDDMVVTVGSVSAACHVGIEVDIDPHGNYIVKPTAMERLFRPTTGRGLTILNHLLVSYGHSLNTIASMTDCKARAFQAYLTPTARETDETVQLTTVAPPSLPLTQPHAEAALAHSTRG